MAKNTFVSGRVKLSVSFNDRTDKYKVKLCPLPGTLPSVSCETVHVGLPGAGARSAHGRRLSVDDPRAMMSAGRAALSFSESGIADFADMGRRQWVVHPPKRARRRR